MYIFKVYCIMYSVDCIAYNVMFIYAKTMWYDARKIDAQLKPKDGVGVVRSTLDTVVKYYLLH